MEENKDLNYWKNNAEEDYINTPISVLRYMIELEKQVKSVGSSDVSGLLPFTDVLELNVCIEKLNTKQITLEEFVSDVWNTAYRVGYDMASEQ